MNNKSRTKKTNPPKRLDKQVFYAYLSGIGLVCAILMVALFLWKAPLLVALGLTGYFYYLVLIVFGLVVAFSLFGVLRSYARYSGKQFGGALELGGPFAGLVLVIILGFVLPPPSTNFSLTVYVHGEAGSQDLILRDAGHVLLDLGSDRRREPIGEKGQAFFPEIPASFRGQKVKLSLDDPAYESVSPNEDYNLDGNAIYLAVRKKPARVMGRVQDEEGNALAGVPVHIAGLTATTDASGHFDLIVPGERVQGEMPLEVLANDFAPWRGSVLPNANEIAIILKREPRPL